MPEINITVMGKVASSDTRSIVNGNSDYVVKWTLDSEWSDFDTKTMRVRHYDGTVIDCIFTGCSCSLPIITETCMIEIGLFAGNLITSTPATISCTRCIMDDEGPVKDPMPDVYAQIMERLDSLEGITPATADKLGAVKIGDNLKITEEGVLSVDTAEAVEQDNTKPVTSAAVYTAKSNIEALLGNLSELETEEKDNLVVAVNEVKQTADAKANAADLAPVATSGRYSDLTDKPAIPDAVTEGTVSGWGFTKNTGTYSKPTGGIPKADLANDVQASLGKAETALQAHQSLAAYRTAAAQNIIDSGKVDKVTGKGLSSNDYTDAAKAKVDAIPANPQYTDTVFSGSYNDLTDKPTIPSVPTATIEANAAARHTHDNKTLLDSITEALKTAWDTASEWISTNGANVLSHLSDGVRHITATERSAWNSKQDKITSTNKLAYSLISGTPTIPTVPTDVSAFTNDAGYLTLATLPKYEGVVE